MIKRNYLISMVMLIPMVCYLQTNTFPSSGNVGVGTTNPDGKLEIYGAQHNTTNLILSANYQNSYRWRFKTNDRGHAIDLDISTSDANDVEETTLKLSHTKTPRPEFQLINNSIVVNDGMVGMGTESPRAKLDVIGGIRTRSLTVDDPLRATDWNELWQSGFYESYEALNAPEPYNWFWGITMNHSTNGPDYRYSGQIAVKNAPNQPVMYFRSTNKEGEGTWAKVLNNMGNQAINGKLEAKEIKVTTTPTADFVFEADYNLPGLDFIESYVKEHKHLPEIASAKEMEQDGVNVGEFQIKLLQKIEELTLYTIRQEKKLKEYKTLESKYTMLQEKMTAMEQLMNQLLEKENQKP